jgi:hypothetical protein
MTTFRKATTSGLRLSKAVLGYDLMDDLRYDQNILWSTIVPI